MAEKSWLENIVGVSFGVVLTALFTLNTLILTTVKGDVREVKSQVMLHLTNHEIHIPREQVVTKAEFTLHQEFQKEQTGEIVNMLRDLAVDFKALEKCVILNNNNIRK